MFRKSNRSCLKNKSKFYTAVPSAYVLLVSQRFRAPPYPTTLYVSHLSSQNRNHSTKPIAVREPSYGGGGGLYGGGVCRMTAEGSTGEAAEGGQAEEREENESGAEVGSGEATAEAAAENEPAAKDEPEMPELLVPTREELEAAFPNPPRAPTPILPDPRKMSPEQLEAAASQDVSYGGQVRVFPFMACLFGCECLRVSIVVVFPAFCLFRLCTTEMFGTPFDLGGVHSVCTLHGSPCRFRFVVATVAPELCCA